MRLLHFEGTIISGIHFTAVLHLPNLVIYGHRASLSLCNIKCIIKFNKETAQHSYMNNILLVFAANTHLHETKVVIVSYLLQIN
jgi:hypothetical protein